MSALDQFDRDDARSRHATPPLPFCDETTAAAANSLPRLIRDLREESQWTVADILAGVIEERRGKAKDSIARIKTAGADCSTSFCQDCIAVNNSSHDVIVKALLDCLFTAVPTTFMCDFLHMSVATLTPSSKAHSGFQASLHLSEKTIAVKQVKTLPCSSESGLPCARH